MVEMSADRDVTTLTDGDGLSVRDNNHGGVMNGGGDVGGSFRSGRIVSTRHTFDGW